MLARRSLQRWLSAAQCAQFNAFGTVSYPGVKPDGHGAWAEAGTITPFYLEWDSGAEPLNVLANKIGQCHRQFQNGLPAWPVLISLHSAVRERNLHDRLAATLTRVAVATSSRDHTTTNLLPPADPIWLAHGRLRLAELGDLAADPLPAA